MRLFPRAAFAAVLAAICLHSQLALAQGHWRRAKTPCPPPGECLCPIPFEEPTKPGQPAQPGAMPTPAPAESADLSSAFETASATDTLAPNMIGDFFGGLTPSIDGNGRFFFSGDFTAIFLDAFDRGEIFPGTHEFEHPLGGQIVLVDRATGERVTVTHDYPGASGSLFAEGSLPPGTIFFSPIVSDQEAFDVAARELANFIPGATLVQLNYDIATGRVVDGSGSGLVNLEYDGSGTVEVLLPVLIVLPAGARPGAQIAQLKVSENNAVLPQDRFIFNYNYFNNVPLTASGFDVNRWAPGFEKSFFGGNASVQVVFPFASTIDSDGSLGAASRNVEFGNIQTLLKLLAWRNRRLAVGLGMGVEVPTADDLGVSLANGTRLLEIRNQSVHLQPFVGALYTQNRFFVQSFLQVDVDVNGNDVYGNPDLTTLQNFGTLYTQPLLLFDTQVGYWLYQSEDPRSLVSAVSGIFEVHYNTSLVGDSGTLEFQGLTARNLLPEFSIVNLTVGSTIQIRDRTRLTLGAAFPVSGDRSFDFEFMAYLNHYFGRSVRRMAPTF